MKPNQRLLADFVEFAHLEMAYCDVEPWAALLAEVWQEESMAAIPQEHVIWLTTLYNTYDSLASAWGVYERWPSPSTWALATDRYDACSHELYPRMTERRNLHGEAVLQRHQSYVDHLFTSTPTRPGGTQLSWFVEPLEFHDQGEDFTNLTNHMRQVWGVGRQAAFEWAEFAGKVFGLPVDAADGQLWESSGPRQSLELMYGLTNPTPEVLEFVAGECMGMLADSGLSVSWVDFETLVCDFKVMVHGRYHVGQHIAAIREEVEGIPLLEEAFLKVIPEPWNTMPPDQFGDSKRRGLYKATGQNIKEPWWL